MSRPQPAVYIETNRPNGTLYVGVTSNLAQRHTQHVKGTGSEFCARYKINRLVWYELHPTMPAAIARETQIKGWRRAFKIALIQEKNPEWHNLVTHLQDFH